jgi:hypothetical protein
MVIIERAKNQVVGMEVHAILGGLSQEDHASLSYIERSISKREGYFFLSAK